MNTVDKGFYTTKVWYLEGFFFLHVSVFNDFPLPAANQPTSCHVYCLICPSSFLVSLLNSQVPYWYTYSVPKRMVPILKAASWNALCVSKMVASLFNFQWHILRHVQMTIHKHFIRQWRRFEQATSHYLNWYALMTPFIRNLFSW